MIVEILVILGVIGLGIFAYDILRHWDYYFNEDH
jgi:hypothetical protein